MSQPNYDKQPEKKKAIPHYPRSIPIFSVDWHFTIPDSSEGVLHLLTIAGHGVVGTWQGELGEHYVAWTPVTEDTYVH